MPSASSSFAYTLVGVKPGIVFSSFDEHPVVLDEEVHSRHARAADHREDLHGQPAHGVEHRLGSRAGTISSIPPASYFASKSYQPSPLRRTISPGRDARRLRVTQYRALHLHAVHEALH